MGDDLQALGRGRRRWRGPRPELAGSAAITLGLVGEFGKLGTDRDRFRHPRRDHAAASPARAHRGRTTFTRRAANLWLGWPAGGAGLGDRHDWPPELRDRLAAGGVVRRAPYDRKRQDPAPRRSAPRGAVRYRIATSNGQLASGTGSSGPGRRIGGTRR